jgi:hypothetical protein
MQIVENWSTITGSVVAAAQSAGWVDVQVHSVAPVSGFSSLVKAEPGTTLRIQLPAGYAAPGPGVAVSIRVRMARGGALFAHPTDIRQT